MDKSSVAEAADTRVAERQLKKRCNMAFDGLAHCGLRDSVRPALIE